MMGCRDSFDLLHGKCNTGGHDRACSAQHCERTVVITAAVTDAMAAPVERGVASAAYSFVRFAGAALAPWLAGVLGEQVSVHLPFWVGAAAVLLAAGVLFATRRHLVGIDVEDSELDEITEQATAVTVGSDS